MNSMPWSRVERIEKPLTKNLLFHAYKDQLSQKLQPTEQAQ